jgi:hypothetical protein
MRGLVTSASILALCAMPEVVAAQTGNAPFCLQTGAGVRCIYATADDCERARGSLSSDQCITRTDALGSTGLGEPSARPETTLPSSTLPSSTLPSSKLPSSTLPSSTLR